VKTTFLLIRHGETNWTKKKRYCGSNDVPLNTTGKKQAARLGKKLREVTIDSVYCSDLRRAAESAALALRGRKIHFHPGLREMNFGIFEGQTHTVLLKKFPALYAAWLKRFGSVTPPQAEQYAAFRKRVKQAFSEIIAKNKGKTCAIVSHGGVMMVMFAEIVGKNKIWQFLPSLASVSVITITGKRKKLVSFNETV
jgi:alpha-ribazole phosphatase